MLKQEYNKILIVEDETALLYALQAQLQVDGFQVEGVIDGEQALEKLKHFKPDLIVLDIMLPKVDGWGILNRVRTDVRLVNIPVIIITNLTDGDAKKKGLELGVVDYIIKADHSLGELAEKIKSALKSH